ncbi:hypothetical protein TRAPUB_1849 [Trametes pubescens]|uniref:LysM domain-containing protein n=1 Tax=Trametes pubescens TaxID=154538 RepID=A0A1M2VI87_TRAPU|nr:hypothetical protein TRAPUB_1849 [Trametes pubescens]
MKTDLGDTEGASHVRARTLDSDAGAGSLWTVRKDAKQHPLRAPSIASSSSVTLDHGTRPTMRRLLSLNDPPDETLAGDRHRGDARLFEQANVQDREMLVIVHEIQPTDSLAGVALKYGISLAELRRANQLWTSDTIHLRDTLYIPVDKARHVRHLKNALLDSDAQPTHSDTTSSHAGPTSEPGQAAPEASEYTLRKVPASQLSYFPPPTHPPSPPRTGGLTPGSFQTMPTRRVAPGRPSIPVAFARSQDAPLQNVFDVFSTSLQSTANHLRALTQSQSGLFAVRPTTSLASRLSLDSTSATASSASEELDWEHEMEDIGPAKARTRADRSPSTMRARRPRSSSRDDERAAVELDDAPFSSPPKHRRSSSSRSHGPSRPNGSAAGEYGARVVPYTDADTSEVQVHAKGVVRTAQLEPSPGMQLPALQRRRPKS